MLHRIVKLPLTTICKRDLSETDTTLLECYLNTNFSCIVPSHFFFFFLIFPREKCLLPLQLALESKSMKLAQHALAGMQVWLWSGSVLAGGGCQENLGFSFEKHYRKSVCPQVNLTIMFVFL